MKRFFLCVIVCFLLVFGGCGAEEGGTTATVQPEVSTTLMIYMIGSDLESKSGAATNDLEEIASSGVDLETNTVLVLTGGSPHWHNDVVGEEASALLKLTTEGFTMVQPVVSESMGEPKSLTDFLNYGYSNFPSERYALILWNHGNGPVMGYGMDELYASDGLLLEEMQQAMADSPFGPENKLAWVGFDACLMASAELACVWDDYAEYLVSSQEIEPHFGWDYQFLAELSTGDVRELLTRVTEDYLANCQNYYAERGYDNRDTTLSCVDLSLTAELETALEALFTRAQQDVQTQYNLLTVQRVRTRALGRATTGSEYDLIDLQDMALQMEQLYPQECAKLQQVLSQMIVANATNTQGCCGLSLYYPFYNKYYYENSWKEIYARLNVLPAYHQYLNTYQQIWLENDKYKQFAGSVLPQEGEKGTYYLALTKEQMNNYAGARYRILRRNSEDLYNCIYTSSDVTNVDGLLVANFDGNIIYVKDKYQNYMIPTVVERDRVGELSRCQISAAFSNRIPGIYSPPSGEELQNCNGWFQLAVDHSTQELTISAITQTEQKQEENTLAQGKAQDIELEQWSEVTFYGLGYSYLTRDAAGTVLPYDQWHQHTLVTGNEFYLVDGMQLIYEPLDGGEYYLTIEVMDTQGNFYSSELLPIAVPDREKAVYQMETTDVQWDAGDKTLLTQQNGVSLYLTAVPEKDRLKFTLELQNSNDFGVYLEAKDLVCNDTVYCESYFGTIEAKPGRTVWFEYVDDLGLAEQAGALTKLTSMQFDLLARNVNTGEPVLDLQRFRVNLSEEITDAFMRQPFEIEEAPNAYLGARAETQLLYSSDTLRVTLMEFGIRSSQWSGQGILQIENLSQEDLRFEVIGIAINNRYLDTYGTRVVIPSGNVGYLKTEVSSYLLTQQNITQISSLQLLLQVNHNIDLAVGFSEALCLPVELTEQTPQADTFEEAQQVVYDKDGIRIALDAPVYTDSKITWRMTVYNGSEHNIQPAAVNIRVNGQPLYGVNLVSGGKAGPGQYGVGELVYYGSADTVQSLTFEVQIRDLIGEKVLFTDTQQITILPKAE